MDCEGVTFKGKDKLVSQCNNNSWPFGCSIEGGRKRKDYFRSLAFLTTVVVIVALSLFITLNIINYINYFEEKIEAHIENEISHSKSLAREKREATKVEKVCLTKGCVTAAADIINRMNESVDPCDDMFEFACGNFIRKTFISEGSSGVTQFSIIDYELTNQLRLIFEEPITKEDSRPTALVKDLYSTCMDTDTINKMGLEPLHKIIKEYGGWPVIDGDKWKEDDFCWIEAMYTSRRMGLLFAQIFDLYIYVNLQNSTERMIWVDQPYLGLAREFLILGANDPIVQAYLQYSIDLAVLLGADQSRAKEEMRQILDLEIKMAELSSTQEERRVTENLFNIKTLKEMNDLVPTIPWVEFINKMLNGKIKVNEMEKINVGDINYITNFTKILEEIPQRVLANYVVWRVVSSIAFYLSDDVRNVQVKFDKILRGKKSRPARFIECIGIVSNKLPFAVGNLYVKNYFDEDSKDQIDSLVTYLRSSFEYVLDNVEWMDDETRKEAFAKLKAMQAYVGYENELLDDQILGDFYAKLQFEEDENLLKKVQNVYLFKDDYIESLLREKVNRTSWIERPSAAIVNAFYRPDQNTIEFPAGILQGHFFQADRPSYMNYGAIGFVIGHEITHGFDDEGRKTDGDGNLRNWWKPEAEEQFQERAQCMIDQYGNYVDPQTELKLNGENTAGENIADNGGLKTAYIAYKNWVKMNGEEDKLPGLDYNPNQIFWISSAQVWCSKIRPEALRNLILTNPHSPPRFRIIGPFTNSKEFAADFHCPVGSKMNPEEKCEVW